MNIQKKLFLFSGIVICIAIIGCISAYFMLSIKFAHHSVAQLLENFTAAKSIQLEESVKPDIALAKKMATSPLVARFFDNPDDDQLAEYAFEELGNYQQAFSSHDIFWINDVDKKYYFNGELSYILDPSDPGSSWYGATLQSRQQLSFNLNYDIGIKQTKLWINTIVYGPSNNPVGIAGTGISLDAFINQAFSDMPDLMLVYFFDKNMKITGAIDKSLLDSSKSIVDVLGDGVPQNVIIDSKNKGALQYYHRGDNCGVVMYLPTYDWYMLAELPVSAGKGTTDDLLRHVFFSAVLLILILTVVYLLFFRHILRPLISVTSFFLNLSDELDNGCADLRKRIQINSRDEIGTLVGSFNKFIDKLQKVIAKIYDSKKELDSVGFSMGSSVDDTASSIMQIRAKIDGMNAHIQNQVERVEKSVETLGTITSDIGTLDGLILGQSSGVAEASASIEEMMGNISSIHQSVDKMAASFSSLISRAQNGASKQEEVNTRIAKIVEQSEMLQEANKAIANIASQTNLLAMNAAIEAAHAGTAGQGFSVVADEIRKLSETSSAQSKTIGERLKTIKDSISEVVETATESSSTFHVVAEQISDTESLVHQIKNALNEQNEGSKQIGQALKLMNDSTEDVRSASAQMQRESSSIIDEMNALRDASRYMAKDMDEMNAGAERITATGERLSNMSEKMRETVVSVGTQIDQFKM